MRAEKLLKAQLGSVLAKEEGWDKEASDTPNFSVSLSLLFIRVNPWLQGRFGVIREICGFLFVCERSSAPRPSRTRI